MSPSRVCLGAISRWGVLCALTASLALAPAASATRPAASKPTGYAQIRRVCAPPAPRAASCLALARVPVSSAADAESGVHSYHLDDGADAAGPAGGLTPAQLASAYGYDPTVGGAGQTVAVIDAYDDPNIEADLGEFDLQYGLSPCKSENGCFEKVGQTGSANSLPEADSSGWSAETTLDVETVHAACRACKILLVEARSAYYEDLAAAVDEAVALGASEISNSYGGPEADIGASERAAYDHPGVVITAAAGDDGYDDWDLIDELFLVEEDGEEFLAFEESPGMPSAPASLPTVVSVGGTSLHLSPDDARASETVWNNNGPADEVGFESGFAQGAGGGGCSSLFTAQPWQQDVAGFAATGCGSRRLVADVAADANPLTGFDIYDSYECGADCQNSGLGKGWVTIGGTSLATPLISSLYALAGGGNGVRFPALTLYGHRAKSESLYDVTEGANGYCDGEPVSQCGDPNAFFGTVDCEATTACNAATGFDGPSGMGAPDGIGAFEPLHPSASIAPPSSPEAGIAASFSAGASTDPYPGGAIASYSWSWGDGSANGVGVSPAHTFAAPGDYDVVLTVTDNYGLSSTPVTQVVDVSERPHQRIEEEEQAKRLQEEEATVKRRQQEEAAAEQRQEEVAAKQRQEDEAAMRKHQEEAAPPAATQGAAAFQAHLTPAVPDARLALTTLVASPAGAVSLKISCPAQASTCAGTVSLRTLDAVAAGSLVAAKRKAVLTLATGTFSVPGGAVRTVTLHLSARARRLLAHSRVLHVRAALFAHDPAGGTHTTQEVAELRLAKRTHVGG